MPPAGNGRSGARIAREASFDDRFLDAGFYADPHSLYRGLRLYEPVYRSEALGCWILTRYDDVAAGLRDRRLSNAGRVAALLDRLPESDRRRLGLLYEHFSGGLIHSDPPDHTRLRRLIGKAFTPKVMERLRGRTQEIVDELLGRVDPEREVDVIRALAFPLPIRLIGDVLGVAVQDLWRFKEWCDDINDILAFTPTLDAALAKQESITALRAYVTELVEARREQPTGDLLSSMVEAEEQGDRLSEAELIQTCATLMIAAHETTTNLIGNGLLTLLRHPAAFEQFRDDPSIVASAVEELLRYEGPLDHLPRIALEDLEIGGKEIRAGELVTFSLLAANRDPERFPDADAVDLARPDNDHLAFGFGIHFCLGAPLARIEGQVALRTLVARYPSLRLLGEPRWRVDRVGHGVEALHVAL